MVIWRRSPIDSSSAQDHLDKRYRSPPSIGGAAACGSRKPDRRTRDGLKSVQCQPGSAIPTRLGTASLCRQRVRRKSRAAGAALRTRDAIPGLFCCRGSEGEEIGPIYGRQGGEKGRSAPRESVASCTEPRVARRSTGRASGHLGDLGVPIQCAICGNLLRASAPCARANCSTAATNAA
jgi:hypothetical protein